MKEIVVISGKGGSGKTSITASLSVLAGKNAVIADCDVDAADMHLLLEPNFKNETDFYSGLLAEINQNKCIKCGKCADVCRFDSIPVINNKFIVQPLDCEGCSYCSRVCPVDAIEMKNNKVGRYFISDIKSGTKMVHASLKIGAENSGKLVAKVKKEAKKIAEEEKKDFILIDGSPGIGCPVVSSLSGADYVLLVTESSKSGFHDLKRVYELVKKFKLKAGCIINKYDINLKITEEIKSFIEEENIDLINELPYDESFTKAMTNGKAIVEYDNGILKDKLQKSWEILKNN